jgi:hypothetical protein
MLMRTSPILTAAIAAALSAGAAGCDGVAEAVGTVEVRISGQDGAIDGIPYDKGDETIDFSDGWSVIFSKFLVAVGNVSAGAASDDTVRIADLHQRPSTRLAALADVPVGTPAFGFDIVLASSSAQKVGDAADADVQRMQTDGLSHLIAGSAFKPLEGEITFEFALKAAAAHKDCDTGADDGVQGLVVAEGETTAATITLHVESLFQNALGSDTAALVFTELANLGRIGGTNNVDNAKLAEAAIDGDRYNKGSASADTMLDYISLAMQAGARVNGEGRCTRSPL